MDELKRFIDSNNNYEHVYYEEAVKPTKKEDADGKVQRKN